jgi:broad specificity phosphatase PhoE
MRTLYLIRHGQASFGAADYDQLSSKGMEQSRLLGAWFKRCGIDVHYAVAGRLKRHLQTAESFFDGYGESSQWLPRLHFDCGFNEVDAVDMMSPTNARKGAEAPKDGTVSMTFADYKAGLKPAYLRWASGLYDHEYGDPFPAYSARCAAAVTKAIDLASPGEAVTAFTSGGTIAMICRQVLELGDATTSSLMWLIGNTSVSRLVLDQDRLVLTLFNSTAHLDHTGDATLLTLT